MRPRASVGRVCVRRSVARKRRVVDTVVDGSAGAYPLLGKFQRRSAFHHFIIQRSEREKNVLYGSKCGVGFALRDCATRRT